MDYCYRKNMATCKEKDCLTHKEKSELSMAARMCWVVDLYQMLFVHVCTCTFVPIKCLHV